MYINKAVIFRAASIGDCLMGKYFLENIHARYPDARLGIVVASRAQMIRDLCAGYPWLEVIEVNRHSPRALLSLLVNFYRSDAVITQYAGKPGGSFSLSSKIMARLLAKKGGLTGFADASCMNGLLYDRLLSYHPDQAIVEHDRVALRTIGVPVSLPFPTLRCVEDKTVVSKFGLTEGKYIIVHLFSGSAGRGLHPDKKRELLVALSERFPNITLVLSGGQPDREEAESVASNLPVRIIAGEATLQEMMNLIKRCRTVLSLDTGIAHLTAQLGGVPLVVLYSCIGRIWWLPEQYGKDALIIALSCQERCREGHTAQDYPACLDGIPVSSVIAVMEEIRDTDRH